MRNGLLITSAFLSHWFRLVLSGGWNFFPLLYWYIQICAVSFPAVNVRHKISTRKAASTSIYEELDLLTLKHSYWFLFLFNKTYFHKRWKGDGAKFFSNGENGSWLTHQYWYWDGSVQQNMLYIVYSDASEAGIAK